MTRLTNVLMIALLASVVQGAPSVPGVHIEGVVPGESGALVLRLSFPDALLGTVWQVYGCDPSVKDGEPLWRPVGPPITLQETVPLPASAAPVTFFMLRRADGSEAAAAQVMRLSRVPAPDGSAALLRVELLPDADARVLFETGFERAEGFVMGALETDPQWEVLGEVVVATAPQKDGQAVRLTGAGARLSREAEEGGTAVRVEYVLYVSTTGVVQAATTQTERPPKRSGSFGYHPQRGFLAYDGDGNGSGRWVLIPESRFFNQWVTIAVDLDYRTKTWSIALNETVRLDDLGFRDKELEQFQEMLVYPGNAGEMFVDDVRVTRTSEEETEQ